ncbi:MAG: cyclic nucleotide-binding domain-containing protein [Pseudomonadales bacterium]
MTFLPGDVIIGERQKGDAFYIITHGEVSVYKKSDDGVEVCVAKLGEGEFLGESSLLYARLLGHVRTATLRAQTPCTLLRFPRRDINAILERNSDLKARLGDLHRSRTAPKAPNPPAAS